jgi:hypothetical protein
MDMESREVMRSIDNVFKTLKVPIIVDTEESAKVAEKMFGAQEATIMAVTKLPKFDLYMDRQDAETKKTLLMFAGEGLLRKVVDVLLKKTKNAFRSLSITDGRMKTVFHYVAAAPETRDDFVQFTIVGKSLADKAVKEVEEANARAAADAETNRVQALVRAKAAPRMAAAAKAAEAAEEKARLAAAAKAAEAAEEKARLARMSDEDFHAAQSAEWRKTTLNPRVAAQAREEAAAKAAAAEAAAKEAKRLVAQAALNEYQKQRLQGLTPEQREAERKARIDALGTSSVNRAARFTPEGQQRSLEEMRERWREEAKANPPTRRRGGRRGRRSTYRRRGGADSDRVYIATRLVAALSPEEKQAILKLDDDEGRTAFQYATMPLGYDGVLQPRSPKLQMLFKVATLATDSMRTPIAGPLAYAPETPEQLARRIGMDNLLKPSTPFAGLAPPRLPLSLAAEVAANQTARAARDRRLADFVRASHAAAAPAVPPEGSNGPAMNSPQYNALVVARANQILADSRGEPLLPSLQPRSLQQPDGLPRPARRAQLRGDAASVFARRAPDGDNGLPLRYVPDAESEAAHRAAKGLPPLSPTASGEAVQVAAAPAALPALAPALERQPPTDEEIRAAAEAEAAAAAAAALAQARIDLGQPDPEPEPAPAPAPSPDSLRVAEAEARAKAAAALAAAAPAAAAAAAAPAPAPLPPPLPLAASAAAPQLATLEQSAAIAEAAIKQLEDARARTAAAASQLEAQRRERETWIHPDREAAVVNQAQKAQAQLDALRPKGGKRRRRKHKTPRRPKRRQGRRMRKSTFRRHRKH